MYNEQIIIDYLKLIIEIKELIAYGAGNLLSSVFKGMPATGGLTRTRIVETSGVSQNILSLNKICQYQIINL